MQMSFHDNLTPSKWLIHLLWTVVTLYFSTMMWQIESSYIAITHRMAEPKESKEERFAELFNSFIQPPPCICEKEVVSLCQSCTWYDQENDALGIFEIVVWIGRRQSSTSGMKALKNWIIAHQREQCQHSLSLWIAFRSSQQKSYSETIQNVLADVFTVFKLFFGVECLGVDALRLLFIMVCRGMFEKDKLLFAAAWLCLSHQMFKLDQVSSNKYHSLNCRCFFFFWLGLFGASAPPTPLA